MARYVEAKIISEYGFERVFIPDDEAEISTSILVTSDWQTNTKLLVMVQNAVGAMMGIFSRSICFDLGLFTYLNDYLIQAHSINTKCQRQ
jgi:hypothetical protein